ncbi:MAG: glycosyltransferase family 4 protein [Lachnospiraceae bacterium]|nr:glycosyltransferase family 4 protein [Lachnospiraceae bacterium]
MLIGIDLLWVRPRICGGTESATRNLINGFGMYDDKNEYMLFVGKDTADTFTEYEKYPNMKVQVCDTESLKRVKRIAWENAKLDKLARSLNVDLMFVPVYSKPDSLSEEKGGIPYITVIHDLQALHFPEYFSKAKIIFAKRSWKKACNESSRIVITSEYCKNDIIENYPFAKDKLVKIYDTVFMDKNETDFSERFEIIKEKYGIEKEEYFYTLSSMLPHKNLETLIKLMKLYKTDDEKTADEKAFSDFRKFKLVVSGVGGNKETFNKCVKEAGVEDMIIDTGFVSDEDRDALYENCAFFLFPSTFEGFGMPPVEAMMKGAKVVTTRCTCIEEITQGKATYVDDPLNPEEWALKIKEAALLERKRYDFPEYELKEVALKYIDVFEKTKNNQ